MATVVTKVFEYGQLEMDYLCRADVALGEAIRRLGKIERFVIPDLFAALVYAIVGQLISTKAVQTIWARMQDRLGEITPHRLATCPVEEIQQCGITMKKATCIAEIAQQVAEGRFDLEGLSVLPDEEVIQRLSKLKGIGRWTAEMLLLLSMERSDVVSWGDIAIRRGMMKLYGLPSLSKDQFEGYRKTYSPYGSVASLYLWVVSFE
ncbi:DNA-3-methyladenine glycosylase family protein [Gorillibacterium timonense]|uniref:DNA-3-methyladenine glycosylase family protein n=1 Tax=Gorillibacterium timonense TaxID=1689269 RepID=UPI00071DBD73|nr:DNA-3-methyladenine glycosylase [Gorillibacterium timonense]